jgi:outer membrane protein
LFNIIKSLLIAFLLVVSSIAHAELKVGYVQMKTIMQSQQMLDIGKKLQNEFKPRNAELEKLDKQLSDKEVALEKDANSISASVLQNKRRDLQRQRLDLERRRTKQHEDFELRKREEINNFQNSINSTISAIGEKEGFDLILYNVGAYIGPRVDITDKVLKQIK